MGNLLKRATLLASVLAMGTALLGGGLPASVAAEAPRAGELPVLDGDGKLLVHDAARGNMGTQSIPPVLGGNFDGYVSGVRVHFAYADQWLDRGRNWTFGNADLRMQTDGNLVIYQRSTGVAKWSTGTWGSGATQMLFQGEANLGVWTSGWASRVWVNTPNARCAAGASPVLGLQADSNFVIYCYRSGYVVPVWASNTAGI